MNIPNFTIEREIGQGGMATVYLARHVLLERQAAVKVMDPSLGREKGFLDKFLGEGRIIARLEHPNIVRVYDVGLLEGSSSIYMAMEYLPGGSLKEKLASGRLPLAETLRILEQVGAGLGLAHDQGFIHRDIKPGNILFRKDGTAVLTDFGIAKLQDSVGELTRMGYTLGTVKYMSPEQVSTTKLDRRSDIYSLGLVFYEMLTGKAAVAAESTAQAIHSHVILPPPQLPSEYAYLQPVLNRVLAKAPADRYVTVAEFVSAARNAPETEATRLLAASPAAIPPQPPVTQVVRPGQAAADNKPFWVTGLLGLLLVGLFAGTFYLFGGLLDGNGQNAFVAPPVQDTHATFPVGGIAAQREKINLVFDASGSMKETVGGIPKIDIARDVLKNVAAGWNDNTERGLLVYGHRQRGDCNDIEQMVPVGATNQQAFIGQVDKLAAMGETPIAKALLMAAQNLRYAESKATIILVSDGKEECGGDPCVVAKQLEQGGIDFTAHVIGFDVQDKTASEQLRCIAEATGGTYQAAKDREEFQATLAASQTISIPKPPKPPVTATKQGNAGAKPDTPPPATTGILRVVSISSRTGEPLKADISVYRLDGNAALPSLDVFALLGINAAHAAKPVAQRLGVTEANFTLKVGKYRVNVRTAEDEKTFDVAVTAGKTVSKSINMADPEPTPSPGIVKVSAFDTVTDKALEADFSIQTSQGEQAGNKKATQSASFELKPGDYNVTATLNGVTQTKPAQAASDKTVELRFDFKQASSGAEPAVLLLKAFGQTDGKALPASFTVMQSGKQVRTVSGFAATISDLPAGEYQINATGGKLLTRGSANVTLKPGESREVVITLKPMIIDPPLHPQLPDTIKPVEPEIVKPLKPVEPEIVKPLKPVEPETVKPLTPVKPETTEPAKPETIKPVQPATPQVVAPHIEDPLKQKLPGELFKNLEK